MIVIITANLNYNYKFIITKIVIIQNFIIVLKMRYCEKLLLTF